MVAVRLAAKALGVSQAKVLKHLNTGGVAGIGIASWGMRLKFFIMQPGKRENERRKEGWR
jgi:hypothetical protein